MLAFTVHIQFWHLLIAYTFIFFLWILFCKFVVNDGSGNDTNIIATVFIMYGLIAYVIITAITGILYLIF